MHSDTIPQVDGATRPELFLSPAGEAVLIQTLDPQAGRDEPAAGLSALPPARGSLEAIREAATGTPVADRREVRCAAEGLAEEGTTSSSRSTFARGSGCSGSTRRADQHSHPAHHVEDGRSDSERETPQPVVIPARRMLSSSGRSRGDRQSSVPRFQIYPGQRLGGSSPSR